MNCFENYFCDLFWCRVEHDSVSGIEGSEESLRSSYLFPKRNRNRRKGLNRAFPKFAHLDVVVFRKCLHVCKVCAQRSLVRQCLLAANTYESVLPIIFEKKFDTVCIFHQKANFELQLYFPIREMQLKVRPLVENICSILGL